MNPALSVILVTRSDFAAVRTAVAHLAAQTVRDQLELVLVAPRAAALNADPQLTGLFPHLQVVEVGDVRLPPARVAGINAARAPIVAFVEDHAWPRPDWAEHLLAAHRLPCAAVGPALVNANPATLTSWVNLLIEYGPWLDPASDGPRAHIPGHNSSYKRDVLLGYGDRLSDLLEAESVLHWDLRARGHEVRLAPAAKTDHWNVSRRVPSLMLRFCVGRMFAATRAGHWPVARRLLYAVAAPLIPLVRFQRIARLPGRPPRLALLPLLLFALVVDAAGECCGYLTGSGRAADRLTNMEVDRPRYLAKTDRERFLNITPPHPGRRGEGDHSAIPSPRLRGEGQGEGGPS